MPPADPREGKVHLVAANDNGDAEGANVPDPETLRKLDDVVLQIARIIGRRMAREDFEAQIAAANDNCPSDRDGVPQDADDDR